MIVKTKNYKLDKKTYINTAFKTILKKQGWMAAVGAIVICLGYFIPGAASIWWFIGAVIGVGIVFAFLVDSVLWRYSTGARQNAVRKIFVRNQQSANFNETQSTRRHAVEVGSDQKRFYRKRPFCAIC